MMTTTKIGLIAFLGALLFLTTGWSASTLAQGKKGKPRVIELEEIQIEGRVQKPNAFYVLNRANLGYEVYDLRTSFVRNIIRSVERSPF